MLTRERIEHIADVRSRGNRYSPPDEIAELKRLALIGHAIASMPTEQREYLAMVATDCAASLAKDAKELRDQIVDPSMHEAMAKDLRNQADGDDRDAAAHRALATILAGVGS